MPVESMEMPQMNMVAQPQTNEQPKAQEPMSMSLRGGGLCEDCCCCCCAAETLCCCLGAEEIADNV